MIVEIALEHQIQVLIARTVCPEQLGTPIGIIGVPNCSKAFLKLFWFLLGKQFVALYEQAGYKSLIVLVFSRLLFLTFQEQILSVELQL